MIWGKPSNYDELRVRSFLADSRCFSETAISLAPKVGVKTSHCRKVLESLVAEGLVRRREVGDIEPIFYRYPDR